METNGTYERQKLDCNCNDCIFMIRSFEHRQKYEDNHYNWQKKQFDLTRRNLLKRADEHIIKGLRGDVPMDDAKTKQKAILMEVKKLTFQFDKGGCTLSYGYCSLNGLSDNKLRLVSFIPENITVGYTRMF